MVAPRSLRPVAALAVLAALGSSDPARAGAHAGGDTLAVEAIRPGMRGFATTVFSGETTDRFEIEVVDVVPNYLPKQDAILFTSPDPRLKHSGIVGGMSGSPIFIEGKLVGALAYGYRFNKDPIGGITPIANMLEVARLPARPEVLPTGRAAGRRGGAAWADTLLGLETSPLPARARPADAVPSAGLAPLGLPMAVSGLSDGASRLLADAVGMVPARGGGRSATTKGPAPARSWKPGDSTSVLLISGDVSVAPNGTVTWVSPKGDSLLAFGHPMFGDGPTNLPFGDARVHTIIPSVDRSVKLSSPLHVRGALIQDRQAAIALRPGLDAPVIPVVTTLRGAEGALERRTYQTQVAVGVDLTPNLLAVLLADAVEEGARDATEVVARVRQTYDVVTSKGPRSVEITEELFFPGGVAPRALAQSRGVLVAAALLDNDFEVVPPAAVRQEIEVEYGAPVETIQDVRVPRTVVHAGEILELDVLLRDYLGRERREIVPVRIPDDAADEDVTIELTGGDFVAPYRPMPSSLDDLLDTLQQTYPSRSLVVSVYREAEGLSTRDGLLEELPPSIAATLKGSAHTAPSVVFKRMARRVLPSKTLVAGRHLLPLSVRPPKTLRGHR